MVLNAAANRLARSLTEAGGDCAGTARGEAAGSVALVEAACGKLACGELVELVEPARGERARGEPACGEPACEPVEPVEPVDGIAAIREAREGRELRTGGSLGGAATTGVADAKSGGRPSTGRSW